MSSSTDVAFTLSVKSLQDRRGSRGAYARMEEKGGFATKIDDGLAAFIAKHAILLFRHRQPRRTALHPASRRPEGILAPSRSAHPFADFSGNRQYITTGNLADNPRAMLFLMDYTQRKRVKIWGTARAVEDDAELIAKLFPDAYKARAEQAIVFTVAAWDANCPQHIPQMLFAEDVAEAIAVRDRRISALEAENALLRAVPGATAVL